MDIVSSHLSFGVIIYHYKHIPSQNGQIPTFANLLGVRQGYNETAIAHILQAICLLILEAFTVFSGMIWAHEKLYKQG